MNVLDRYKKQKNDYKVEQRRLKKSHITTAIKCTALAFAIVLHRRLGVGKIRFSDIFKDVFDLMDGYIDSYGGECIETALIVKARDEVGVEIEMG